MTYLLDNYNTNHISIFDSSGRKKLRKIFHQRGAGQDHANRRVRLNQGQRIFTILLKRLGDVVGPNGLEPSTSSVSRKRSNQLSYGPTLIARLGCAPS